MEKFDYLAIGTAIILIGDLLGAAARFGIRLVGAQYFSANEYGSLVLSLAVLELVALVCMVGLPNGLPREISRSTGIDRGALYAILLCSTFATVLCIVIIHSASYISHLVGSSNLAATLSNIIIALPALVIVRCCVGIFRGKQITKYRVLVENIGTQFGLFLLFLTGGFLGFSLNQSVLFWPFSYILSGALSIYLVISKLNIKKGKSARSLLVFSAPLMLSEAIWTIMEQADNFLIGYYLNLSSVGSYDAAFTLCRALLLVTTTFGYLFLPEVSKLEAEGDIAKIQNIYQKSTKWMVFISFIPLVILLGFRIPLLQSLFGTEYITASEVLIIISIGTFIHVLTGMNGYTLIGFGEIRTIIAGNLIGLFSNIVLNIILIPTIGMIGAAISSVISYSISNGFWNIIISQEHDISPFPRELIVVISVFIPALYLSIWLGWGYLALLVLICVYLPTIWVIGVTQKEKSWLYEQVNSYVP